MQNAKEVWRYGKKQPQGLGSSINPSSSPTHPRTERLRRPDGSNCSTQGQEVQAVVPVIVESVLFVPSSTEVLNESGRLCWGSAIRARLSKKGLKSSAECFRAAFVHDLSRTRRHGQRGRLSSAAELKCQLLQYYTIRIRHFGVACAQCAQSHSISGSVNARS